VVRFRDDAAARFAAQEWESTLAEVNDATLERVMRYFRMEDDSGYPPSLPRFMELCRQFRTETFPAQRARLRQEPGPPPPLGGWAGGVEYLAQGATMPVAQRELATMREILRRCGGSSAFQAPPGYQDRLREAWRRRAEPNPEPPFSRADAIHKSEKACESENVA
jgi:hypothetical protein